MRYGLVTEQTKGSYKYFIDLGDRMEVATSRTVYVDEVDSSNSVRLLSLTYFEQDRQADVDKAKIVYGVDQGATATVDEEDEDDNGLGIGVRTTKPGQRVSRLKPNVAIGLTAPTSHSTPQKKFGRFGRWVLNRVKCLTSQDEPSHLTSRPQESSFLDSKTETNSDSKTISSIRTSSIQMKWYVEYWPHMDVV